MKVSTYILEAFTKDGAGGNAAGVVLDTQHVNEEDMQAIASDLNVSETAFLFSSTVADYQIRYFTPAEEVDLCGHATVALFSLLKQRNEIKEGSYTIETRAGVLQVKIDRNNRVFVQQNLPQFLEIIPPESIERSLNISSDMLVEDLPIQIVSTGLRDIIVPIKTRSDLLRIQPNMNEIAEISKKYGVIGYHVFTLDTLHNSSAHCRNFAPVVDIPEESATGTSNAALACYLVKHGYGEADQSHHTFYFEQGYSLGKPSEIMVQLFTKDRRISNVYVGGYSSMVTKQKEFSL